MVVRVQVGCVCEGYERASWPFFGRNGVAWTACPWRRVAVASTPWCGCKWGVWGLCMSLPPLSQELCIACAFVGGLALVRT